jgi:hypothetical protein
MVDRHGFAGGYQSVKRFVRVTPEAITSDAIFFSRENRRCSGCTGSVARSSDYESGTSILVSIVERPDMVRIDSAIRLPREENEVDCVRYSLETGFIRMEVITAVVCRKILGRVSWVKRGHVLINDSVAATCSTADKVVD